MATKRNAFLDAGYNDASDQDEGYDSEAAEVSKGHSSLGRPSKRRRLSSDEEDDEDNTLGGDEAQATTRPVDDVVEAGGEEEEEEEEEENAAGKAHNSRTHQGTTHPGDGSSSTQPRSDRPPKDKTKRKKTPGVIYLSSLPPYLKPSALRHLLLQRGFSPITRLFLTPASKAKSSSKKNSRQLYTEGWIEFAAKKTARRCAEGLNANPVGGKKGGFYRDDVWNMKYLSGVGWAELMAGVREERREEEGRRDEERRRVVQETKGFLEGVEEGKRVEGMRRKRARTGKEEEENSGSGGGDGQVKRTWRQFGAKGGNRAGTTQTLLKPVIDETARRVLGKIF